MRSDLATKHLAIAPHYTVHREAPDRLLLFSEDRSLRMPGELYVQLAALLTGDYTGAQIAQRIDSPDLPQVMERLYDKEQIVAVMPRRDMNRQAYWSALGKPPNETEEQIARYRVAVIPLGRFAGTDSAGAAALAAGLLGAGLTIADMATADLTIVTVDDYLDPAVMSFARQVRPDQRWMLVKPGGDRALIGPIFSDTDGACPTCLARRLTEHRPNDGLARDGVRVLRPARAWMAATLDLARALTVLEVTRLALGEAVDIENHVVSVDTLSGDRKIHRHWRFLDCPVCGTPHPDRDVTHPPIHLGHSDTVDSEVGGWRTLTAEQALERLEPLISNITGIVSDIQPARDFDKGLYVYNAVQASPTPLDHMQNRRAGNPSAASGKGLTPLQARVSCLAEAVERYSSSYAGTEPRRAGRLADIGPSAWHPHALLHFSDYQYDNRDALNAETNSLHYIPERFDEDAEIDWSPLWSLTRQDIAWVPTRYCYTGYRPDGVTGDHGFSLGDSNGCASGATLTEAILQGMLELVERDAVAIWWYNRLRRPGISLDGINDRFIEQMLSGYESMGRTIHLLDLTNDVGIPAAVAVSAMKATRGRVLMGFGAHVDPRIAAERALTELNQLILFDGPDGSRAAKDEFGNHLTHWLDTGTLDTDPYLAPSDGPARTVDSMTRLDAGSIEGAVRAASDRFAELGMEMLVLDYARTDMPLSSVKIIVPGLRHFWARRGPGRLNDVPVSLGWLDQANPESALNPINFVL